MSLNYTYNDHVIRLSIGDTRFTTLNLLYNQFHFSISQHSHGHGCYEIHYVPSGCGYITMNDKSYALAPGCLYVAGPLTPHAQFPDPTDPMYEYCIYLKIEHFSQNTSEPLSADTKALLQAFEEISSLFCTDAWQIGELIVTMFKEMKKHQLGYETIIQSLLHQLLVHLARYSGENSGKLSPPPPPDRTALTIDNYFLFEYATLSLEGLAEKLNITPRHTQRMLDQLYGKTFQQLKTEARMSAAAVMLKETDKSISEIAENTGYSSLERFSSVFREYYHISPRQYRKNLKNSIASFTDA